MIVILMVVVVSVMFILWRRAVGAVKQRDRLEVQLQQSFQENARLINLLNVYRRERGSLRDRELEVDNRPGPAGLPI